MQMSFLPGFLAVFDWYFQGLNNLKPQFALFATPFDVDAESVSEEFQMKVLDLKCDKQKQKYTDMSVSDFYNFFQKKVSKISLCSLWNRLMVMFGCTYVCEQFFSSMKINKSALWSRLTSINVWMQHCNWLTPVISKLTLTLWFLPNQR